MVHTLTTSKKYSTLAQGQAVFLTEPRDTTLVEVSTDGGRTWSDLAEFVAYDDHETKTRSQNFMFLEVKAYLPH